MTEATTRRPVKAAMIGLTGWARTLARGAAEAPEIELVTGFARTSASRQAFAHEFGCEIASSYESLLADPRIEAVILGTPNHVHSQQTLQAARAGKHVFVEKPIANRLDEAEEMMEACESAGVVLFVGHNYRRRAEIRKLKSLLEGGSLGQVIMVEGHNSHPGGFRLTPESWRWHEDTCPSGPLMQLAIHIYDALHYLVGPIRRVTALFQRGVLNTEIPDTALTLLEFESGALGYVGSAYVIPHTAYIALYGTEANAHVDRQGSLLLKARADDTSRQLAVDGVDTVAEELSEFALCVREGQRPETGGPEALSALKVVLAAIASHQTGGKPVKVT